jgi:toxin ParE1/3/4
MKAYWTIKAVNRLQRLQQVHDYLGQSEPVPMMFVERLTRLADNICRDPEAGYEVPYFVDEDVREVIDGSYRVIYRILEDEIHILTVRHVPRAIPARAYQR